MSGIAKKLMMSAGASGLPPTPDPDGIDFSSIPNPEISAGSDIHDVQWNNDGTWISGIRKGSSGTSWTSVLNSWPLSTAYDLSTAGTKVQTTGLLRSASFMWNANGTAILLKYYNNMLFQSYPCSTAWDPSTISLSYTTYDARSTSATYMVGQVHNDDTGHFTAKPDWNQWYFGAITDKVTMYKSSGGVPTNPAASSTQTSNYMQLNVGSYSTYGGNSATNGCAIADSSKVYVSGSSDRRASTWSIGITNELGVVNFSTLKTTNQGIVNEPYMIGGRIQNNGTTMVIPSNWDNILTTCQLSTAWDVTTQGAIQNSPSISTQEAYASDMFFEPGGNYVQYSGPGNDKIWRHYVSSAWNVSTMSSSPSQSSVSLGYGIRTFTYANSGYKLYVTDTSGNIIKQYNCSTAYRPDTASLTTTVDFDTPVKYGSNGVYLYGISVMDNGTKLWLNDGFADNVLGFKMTTAHDVSTIVPDKWHQNISRRDDGVRGIKLKSDGTKMIVNEGGELNQYNLSTAWDVSSHSMTTANSSFNPTSPSSAVSYGLAINGSGTRIATTKGNAGSNTKITAQTLTTAWDLSTASASAPSNALAMPNIFQFKFIKDGTQIYGMDGMYAWPYDEHAVIRRWELSTAWDLSTATLQSDTFTPTYNGGGVEGVTDIDISPDGTILTYCSTNWDDTGGKKTVRSQVMSTANNLSTMGASLYTSAANDSYNYTLAVDGDGGKVYLIGETYEQFVSFSNNGNAYRWTGSNTFTGLDISNLPVYNPRTARFNTTGSKIWVHAQSEDRIYAFPLTDYYDVSSGSVSSNSYVSTAGTVMEAFTSFDIGDNDSKFFFLTGGVLYVADLS
tara:strand:- start:3091 stop:5616 length:2526 start_codon:yes stop_codon:yes gene_type:complete